MADSIGLTRYAFAMLTINGRLGLLAATIVIIPAYLPAQQTKTTKVQIAVSDSNGARIAHARIKVVPTPDNLAKLETNDAGIALLDVVAGGYALFVSSPGFKPAA